MVRYSHSTPDGVEFIFREPVKTDARELMRFINSVVAEPMSGLMMDKKVSMKDEERWLSARLSEVGSRTVVMLLVVKDGRVLGNCHMSRLTGKHSHRAVIGVALMKDARGMGIGEAVMRKTLELGARRFKGVESVDLSAFAYNARALALYKKLGFKEYGRVPRSAKEGDRYFDEVLMRLELVRSLRGRESTSRP